MPEQSPYEIVKWLEWNGITPLPCRPMSKVPIDQISTFKIYGGDKPDDSFHVASPERMAFIRSWWGQEAFHLQAGPGDESISVDCSPGYNSLRRIFGVDVDTDVLFEAAMSSPELAKCPAIRGKKGVKLIGFITGAPPAIVQFFEAGNDSPLMEVFTDGKHMLVYGEHPDSTPENRIYYTVIRGIGTTIPILSWDRVKAAVFKIAEQYDLTTTRILESPLPVKKPITKFDGPTIANRCHVLLEDICHPGSPVVKGRDIYGINPFHGSTTGINLHIDTANQRWYCHRCHEGGGVVAWLAIKHVFETGYRSPNICREVVQKMRSV